VDPEIELHNVGYQISDMSLAMAELVNIYKSRNSSLSNGLNCYIIIVSDVHTFP
jgi:hypothetical protein